MIKCNSCGATYRKNDSTRPDYFHACAEQILVTSDVLDDKNKIIKPATFRPMPNPRNENLKPNPDKPGEYVMISEGSGVTEIE